MRLILRPDHLIAGAGDNRVRLHTSLWRRIR